VPLGRAVQGEPLVFEQHREVGRLLHLDQQDAGADRVRHPGRAEHGVTGAHLDPVGGGQHLAHVLPGHPAGQLRRLDIAGEAEVHNRVRLGRDDHPGFGLPVRGRQVTGGEAPVGVHVQRQPLARVEQLDQHPGLGAPAGPEPPRRVGHDRLGQHPPVGQRG
jgi:hypothetical protein